MSFQNHESMFETYLKVANANDRKSIEERATVDALKKLPPDVLFKIANGETKLGYGYLKACSSDSGGIEWVEQFKDTPLFEQALQLEQQSIQIEQMEQQHRAQRDAERDQEPKFYEMQDRLRLQKRLLGLQLAAAQLQQAGAAAAPAGPAAAPPPMPEAAGAIPPVPPEGKVAFIIPAMGGAAAGAVQGHESGQTGRGALLGGMGAGIGGLGGAIVGSLAGQGIGRMVGGPEGQMLGGLAGGTLGQIPGGILGYQRAMQRLHSGKKPDEENKEAFDRAAEMGQRMAQGDYDRAVTLNLAAEMGRDLAKTATPLLAIPALIGGVAGGIQGANNERPIEGALRGTAGATLGAGLGGIGGLLGGGMLGGMGGAVLGGLAGGALRGREGAIAGAMAGGGLGAQGGALGGGIGGAYIGGRDAYHAAMKGIDRPHAEISPENDPRLLEAASAQKKHLDAGGSRMSAGQVAADSYNGSKEKKALDMGALAGMGQKAMGVLGQNPGAALGAAAGAAGGLAHGMQKDTQGQRHLGRGLMEGVAGAAGGALAGHATQNIGGAMRGGATLGQAARGYGQQVRQAGGQAMDALRGARPAPVAGATPLPQGPAFGSSEHLKSVAGQAEQQFKQQAPTMAGGRVPPTQPMGNAPTLPSPQGGQGRVTPAAPITQPATPPASGGVSPTMMGQVRRGEVNPTMMGNQQMQGGFSALPQEYQNMIRQHPMVAGGHLPPEAAHKLMGWSMNKGEDYYSGLRRLSANGAPAAAQAGTMAASPRAMAAGA